MSELTVSALRLIRETCAKAAGELSGDNAMAMQRVDTVLGRLIAEETLVQDVAASAADRIRGFLDKAEPATYGALSHELGQRIANLPEGSGALPDKQLVAKTVAAELDYWNQYLKVMQGATKPVAAKAAGPEGGTTFDPAVFLDFMRKACPDESDLEIDHFYTASLGYSKKTILVKLRNNKVLPDELAVRIDQPFNYLGTTVRDEYPIVDALWKEGVCLPQPLAYEGSGDVFGQPFIVFAKVQGAPIGSNFVYPARNDAVVSNFARELAKLHAVPMDKSGLPADKLDPSAYLDQEIAKYRQDWDALGADCPIIEAGFKWVNIHRAFGDGPASVVHNDYSYSNVLCDEGRITSIVDWEFAHAGTPAADIGYFYYSAEGVASYDLFLREYAAAGGQLPPQETLDFYILWGQVRLAIMGFQTEIGFQRGQFQDIKFGVPGALMRPHSMNRIGSKLMELIEKY